MAKLTSDAKFEVSDIKASVAAIAFILSSAAKHSVDGSSLDNEMQQLGLPKGKLPSSPSPWCHYSQRNLEHGIKIDCIVLQSTPHHYARSMLTIWLSFNRCSVRRA